jgi:hypothetical protein
MPDPSMGQSEDRHRVSITFDSYGISARELIHPKSGCQTADHCGQCGRAFDNEDVTPCYDCTPPISPRLRECWVTGWFENLTAEELFSGTVVLDVEPEFKADACTLHIVGASMPEKVAPGPPLARTPDDTPRGRSDA